MGKPVVLIVEDDEASRELLATFLEDEGYPVMLAKDGLDALRKVNSGVGIVVSDLEMPRMDGLRLAHWLRQRADTADIPIVFLTGVEPDWLLLKASEDAGAMEVISKPVPFARLRATLEALGEMKENARRSGLSLRTEYELGLHRGAGRQETREAELERDLREAISANAQ
jgi:CheY-like chemotaxis protein